MAELRQTSLGILVMLVIQYAVGISYTIYGTMPTAHKSIGLFSSGPVLILHEFLSLILLGGSIHVLRKAIGSRRGPAIGASVISLLAILGAGASGIAFLRHGSNAASMGMAMATAVAMLCNLVNLAVATSPHPGQLSSPPK
jgi:hypothetical protein